MAFEGLRANIAADASSFVGETGDASGALGDLDQSSAGASESLLEINHAGAIAGGALAGLGVGLQRTLDNNRDLNESLDRSARRMGISQDAATDLVTGLSDVTLSNEEAAAAMETFLDRGVDTEEQMEALIEGADNIGDAVGESADVIADSLAPQIDGLDGDMDTLIDNQDAWTTIISESSVTAQDLGSTLSRVSFEALDEMGLKSEEVAGLMAEFADETGLSGKRLQTEFNSALEDADGDLAEFEEGLGLGEGALEDFEERVEDNAGVTEELGGAVEDNASAMDHLRARVDDAQLQFSQIMQPLSAVAPAMMGVGGAAAGLSAVNVGALIPSLAGVAAAAAPVAVPLLAIAAVAGGLAWLFRDELAEGASRVVDVVGDNLMPVVDEFRATLSVWHDKGREVATFIREEFGDELQFLADIGQRAAELYGKVLVVNLELLGDALRFIARLLRGDFSGAMEIAEETGDRVASTISRGFGRMTEAIVDAALFVPRRLRRMGEDALDALPGVADLEDIGRRLIEGLADGIRDRARAPLEAVENITDGISDFLPGSDAEVGALANLTAQSRAIPETLADEIEAGTPDVVTATDEMADAATVDGDDLLQVDEGTGDPVDPQRLFAGTGDIPEGLGAIVDVDEVHLGEPPSEFADISREERALLAGTGGPGHTPGGQHGRAGDGQLAQLEQAFINALERTGLARAFDRLAVEIVGGSVRITNDGELVFEDGLEEEIRNQARQAQLSGGIR